MLLITLCWVSCDGQASHPGGVVILLVTLGAFFWDYSGIGILGIDGICVLLGTIPFSE